MRLFVYLTCLAPLVVALPGSPAAQPDDRLTLRGQVVPLAGLLEQAGSRLDRDAAPHWLALVADDGKTYLIVKDDGGRRFFKDERLLGREVRVTGRLFRGTQLLQVLTVHGIEDGKLLELYYWCDICQIKRFELNECECCGGEMIFKNEPAGP